MKHKTWFRLVLKAIGVLLVGLSLPKLIAAVSLVAFTLLRDANSSSLFIDIETVLLMLLQGDSIGLPMLLIGLYLFFGGEWIVNKAIPSNRPYCANCGYAVTETLPRCPECGVELPTIERNDAPADGAADKSAD